MRTLPGARTLKNSLNTPGKLGRVHMDDGVPGENSGKVTVRIGKVPELSHVEAEAGIGPAGHLNHAGGDIDS